MTLRYLAVAVAMACACGADVLKYKCWHCIRKELFILHTVLRTVTDMKRRYMKHCVNKMVDSSRPGKFLTLLTLERSSFRENATVQAPFFTRSICQDLNESLNIPQMHKRPKKEWTNKLSNKQTDSRIPGQNTIPLLRMCAHEVISSTASK